MELLPGKGTIRRLPPCCPPNKSCEANCDTTGAKAMAANIPAIAALTKRMRFFSRTRVLLWFFRPLGFEGKASTLVMAPHVGFLQR